MTIQRLENIGIVVEDLDEVTRFFVALGLTLLAEDTVEGEWVDQVVGLEGVRTRITMLQTPDGQGQLELMQFLSPAARPGEPGAPPNTLGIRRLAFSVDDIDADVAALRSRGYELRGQVAQYEDAYRLCYVTGPEGIIVMLAQPLR